MSTSEDNKPPEKQKLNKEELRFCELRAQGHNQTQAYRQAYNQTRIPSNSASARAAEVAKRPRVIVHLKRLWAHTSKNSLLSHSEYLSSLMRDRDAAQEAENYTAVAAFQRLIGQAIGSLSDNVNINERPDTSELIKRIAQNDASLANKLSKMLSGRSEFDA